MELNNILFAFILTSIAGLYTGIGSLIALLAKRTNTKFLCASLGFSAGVMIYVSFMEKLPTAKAELSAVYGDKGGCAIYDSCIFCRHSFDIYDRFSYS